MIHLELSQSIDLNADNPRLFRLFLIALLTALNYLFNMPRTPKAATPRAHTPLPPDESSMGGPPIVVTAQQSRFHADANDPPDSKEIDIKDLTVAIGGKEVVEHANLKIREGTKYVFVGRNGTGKSTLLRALAEGRIPGVPSNLRILLLGQTRIESGDLDENSGGSSADDATNTVLQHVLRSDKSRERALREVNGESLLCKTR